MGVLAASMFEKVGFMWPEISLFIATCVVMVVGAVAEPAGPEALRPDFGDWPWRCGLFSGR
jgi:hypothetical protein